GSLDLMNRYLLLAMGLVAWMGFGAANARAADAKTDPATPSYAKHVTAVFSRLGCNGGTCHGAVKGQNGFRLSLFGGDPTGDYERLMREFGARRLSVADPDASLLLK